MTRPRFPLLLVALAAPLVGCGPQGVEARDPGEASAPPPAWNGRNQSLRIPGGDKCLHWLSKLDIQHRVLDPKPGIQTPVEVTGPIAGVAYGTHTEPTIVADCRLVLALDWIGPSLTRLGVRRVRHSGAYVLRTQRSGRPSLHAQGLAIDLHEFDFGEERASVEGAFERGHGDGCGEDSPSINQLVCRLRRLSLFQELITPDHDADHHDHIHLGIAPRDGQG